MKYSLILLPLLLFATSYASDLDLTLPIYHLQIDSVYLKKLYRNPWIEEYFPAVFFYDSTEYRCEVRFRGGTARTLPKKSWAIRFDNNDNIFQAKKINLNAEYQDRSLMRNHIAMRLFQHSGYPAPNTEYVNFFVNDEYKGVFVQVEEVNEDFLRRNHFQSNNLYEAKIHGASMTPLTHYDYYSDNWDKKLGEALDFTDIQMLFSKLFYWTKSDFEQGIGNEIDLDNVLNYFAVEFVIVGQDCFTKNLFLFFNNDKNKWEIFPWDNDATYGNDFRGNYHVSYEQFYQGSPLDHQILFQRLMEFELWRNKFWDNVNQIIHGGFDYLISAIDSTYDRIKNDVYQDHNKFASNSGFDNAVDHLKSFIQARTSFLEGFSYFEKILLSEFFCSNPFPSQVNPTVIFRVKSESPQPIELQYTKNLTWGVWADHFTIETLKLFDDGMHHDQAADDLIYGNSLTFATSDSGLIPFCFKGSDFYYPANGLFYINFYRTNTYAINVNRNFENLNQQVSFGNVYKNKNDYFVEIINVASEDIDVSYCCFQAGAYFHNFLLPENSILSGKDTLILTTHKTLAAHHFSSNKVIGNFFFNIDIGDTLKLVSSTLTDLIAAACDTVTIFQINPVSIVINEINYNSADSLDTEDWVELYNPNDFFVDISGWYFKDEDDNHIFVFPDKTIINQKDYLVLCRSQSKINHFFPEVNNYVGDFDFGLSGSGELIRLFDIAGNLIDSLVYDDDPPWPIEADGSGATLELLHPSLDNSLAKNWDASTNHGTPGKQNSVYTGVVENQVQPRQFRIYQNYPNPFNHKTRIDFDLAEPAAVVIKIYNIKGQLIKRIKPRTGERSVIFDLTGFSSGIYLYQIELDGRKSAVNKAILLN